MRAQISEQTRAHSCLPVSHSSPCVFKIVPDALRYARPRRLLSARDMSAQINARSCS